MNINKLTAPQIWDLFINMDVKEFLIHSPRNMTVIEICEDFVAEFDEVIPIEITEDERKLIFCSMIGVIGKSGLVEDLSKPYPIKIVLTKKKKLRKCAICGIAISKGFYYSESFDEFYCNKCVKEIDEGR